MTTVAARSAKRQIALYAVAGLGLAVWAFPVIWGLLTSFTELNLGYGSSLAMVLLAITFAISWFMFRLRRKAT